jgi:hypothetical protein
VRDRISGGPLIKKKTKPGVVVTRVNDLKPQERVAQVTDEGIEIIETGIEIVERPPPAPNDGIIFLD